MSGQAEEAGAALLAALTGLSPAAATPERSEPQKASAGQFSLGGSSALKAAASKGFKFKKEEPQAAAAQEEPKPKVSPLLTPTQIERAASPAKMTHEEVERMMQVKLQVVGAGGKAVKAACAWRGVLGVSTRRPDPSARAVNCGAVIGDGIV